MLPYPALHASHGGFWIATDGGVRSLGRGEAIGRAAETPVILLNTPLIGQRLGHPELSGLDLLELFAFVHPARFAVPTPKGLADALAMTPPADDGAVAPFLLAAANRLLDTLAGDWPEREGAWTAAQSLFRLRWAWAPAVTQRLSKPALAERWLFSKLPEWEEAAPRPAPRTVTIADEAVAARLAALTGTGAERREGQRAYAAAATRAFAPRMIRDTPNMVLAEAGRGSARRSAISRPRRSGRSRRTGRCGYRPSPRRCNASSARKRCGCTRTRRSGDGGW